MYFNIYWKLFDKISNYILQGFKLIILNIIFYIYFFTFSEYKNKL